MTKKILIDENANLTLKTLLSQQTTEKQSRTGLLIGTIETTSSSTDYILNITATPIDEKTVTTAESEAATSVDYDWINNHAIQIHNMLVGGMDILGVYCADMTATSGKQVLIRLFQKLKEFEYYNQMNFNPERLLFLVDTKTKKIDMKSFNVSETSGKSTFQQCELTIRANLFQNEFFKLNSSFSLKSIFKTPNLKSHSLLREDFYAALSTEDMLTDENKYVLLINDSLVDETKSFAEFKSTIDKQESTGNKLKNEYEGALMENLSSAKKALADSKESPLNDLDSIYELTGVCNLVVLFHKSMSIKTIKSLLIYDLMRSLYARVRLLVDDLDARNEIIGDGQTDDPNSNDVSSIEEAYQTPNRIQIILDSNYLICDYVFPDESDSDICERVKELFNYEITNPKAQIIFVEDFPPEIKRSQSNENIDADGSGIIDVLSGSNSDRKASIRGTVNSSQSSFDFSQVLFFSLLVALIGIILAGYYSFKNEID